MDPTQKTVLVADDNEDVRVLFRIILSDEGYHVLTAADGEEALRLAHRCAPDVVLLDINMPNVDGFEFLVSYLGEAGRAAEVAPVIACSSNPHYKGAALELGAAGFLEKPVTPEELARVVTCALREPASVVQAAAKTATASLRTVRRLEREERGRIGDGWRQHLAKFDAYYDRVAKLVRAYFNTMVALVNLVMSDSVFVLGADGAPEAYGKGMHVSATKTFCKLATEGDEPLVICRTQSHPFYKSHEATALGVGGYAAAPWRTPVGLPIGTICLVSPVPFSFDLRDSRILVSVAERLSETVFSDEEAHDSIFQSSGLLRPALHGEIFQSELVFALKYHQSIGFALGAFEDLAKLRQEVDDLFSQGSWPRLAVSEYDERHFVLTQVLGEDEGTLDGLKAFAEALEKRLGPFPFFESMRLSRETPVLSYAQAAKYLESRGASGRPG